MGAAENIVAGIIGGTGAYVADRVWKLLPGHDVMTRQYEKSPLSFIEHYHAGLALAITGNPFLMGAGSVLVGEEFFSENPFGAGKTEAEVTGNIILTSLMVGLASVDFEKIKKHFRKETSKLDRWIYHKDIREYFKEEKKKEEK